jgi:hypothetical protein
VTGAGCTGHATSLRNRGGRHDVQDAIRPDVQGLGLCEPQLATAMYYTRCDRDAQGLGVREPHWATALYDVRCNRMYPARSRDRQITIGGKRRA